MTCIDRRTVLAGMGSAFLISPAFAAAPPGGFVMWHAPGCGCCLEWRKRMQAAFGAPMPIVEAPDMHRIKAAQGVPEGFIPATPRLSAAMWWKAMSRRPTSSA
jgi:hypothetical protein